MKNKPFKQFLYASLLGLLALSAPFPSKANATTLADLLAPGAEFTVGNLIFYDFKNYSSTATSTALPIDASSITVTAAFLGIEEGLRFQPLGMSVDFTQIIDVAFDFSVRTANGADLIIDDYLSITGGATGHGVVNVAENITDENNIAIPGGNLLAFENELYGQNPDSAVFAPQNILRIHKDAEVAAHAFDCTAEGTRSCTSNIDHAFLSDFFQLFSQQPPRDVPEPSSMILLGLGMVGLRFVQRKRSSK